MNDRFDVKPLTPAIGGEISGLDLSIPIPAETLAELRKVWLERQVVIFRDQSLSPEQQLAFAQQFCEVDKYPFLNGIDGHPMVAPILKLPEERINFGGMWHSDTCYLDAPAAGAILHAIELPPLGGDTLFANMVLAWETLDPELQKQVADLRVECTSGKASISKTRADRLKDSKDASSPDVFESLHPVVRTHPETGEKILYVNEAHAVRFEGWKEEDSEPVLQKLYAHQRIPELQCRIQWSEGAVVMWDNRSCHHYPVNDYHGHRRLLHRVSLKGDIPF
ncbi:MAG: TauD/TfdA dioxygenase family protein [Myxococcota bacterium]